MESTCNGCFSLSLFSVHVYKNRAFNHEKIKDKALGYVKRQYEKNPSTFPDAWDADVFTTFGKRIDFDWADLIMLYQDNLIELATQYGIAGDAYITDAWFNAYKKNQHQEIHEHLPGQFSAVHYLAYDKNVHSPTLFLSPYRQVSMSNAPPFKSNDPDFIPSTWNQLSYINVDEGDLIIFPSFLEHKVGRQTTNKLRATIAFNFGFK